MSNEPKHVVSVTTQKEQNGITATVVMSNGEVHEGRDHPSYHLFNREPSENTAINNAMKKVR